MAAIAVGLLAAVEAALAGLQVRKDIPKRAAGEPRLGRDGNAALDGGRGFIFHVACNLFGPDTCRGRHGLRLRCRGLRCLHRPSRGKKLRLGGADGRRS